ncbi:MAG: class I SAM-dependent methyltransferase [Candidatus Jacksonbacteria bacterium]
MGELKERNYTLEKKETSKKRVILEIGGGENPITSKLVPEQDRIVQLAKNNQATYICLEPRSNQDIATGKERTYVFGNITENCKWIRATGEQLPFKNGTIDEILIIDVLSVIRVSEYTHRNEKINLKKDIIKLLLQECYRVLTLKGELKIIENCTPDPDESDLICLANNQKFELVERQELSNYDNASVSMGAYALVFMKSKFNV